MCQKLWPPPSTEAVADIVDRQTIERPQHAGFALVPLRPTDEMKAVGAPSCFIVPGGTMETALCDAGGCYQAMVEVGCL